MENTEITWKSVWKWDGPERIKTFLWLAMQEKLLTKQELMRRHILDEDSCESCLQTRETTCHALRDCPTAKQVWDQLVPSHFINTFYSLQFHEWILKNLRNDLKIQTGERWPLIFGIGLWRIWFWRNQARLHQGTRDTASKREDILTRAAELKKIKSLKEDAGLIRKEKSVHLQWSPPSRCRFKLNTDGACNLSTGVATAGGAIRNEAGEWIKGFSMHIGLGEATRAELWGLLKGLQLAWDTGIRDLQVEIDNLEIVKAIEENHDRNRISPSLVSAIREILNKDWQVHLKHIYRESNQVADRLAKLAVKLPLGEYVYETPPNEIMNVLCSDCMGVSTPRTIIV